MVVTRTVVDVVCGGAWELEGCTAIAAITFYPEILTSAIPAGGCHVVVVDVIVIVVGRCRGLIQVFIVAAAATTTTARTRIVKGG